MAYSMFMLQPLLGQKLRYVSPQASSIAQASLQRTLRGFQTFPPFVLTQRIRHRRKQSHKVYNTFISLSLPSQSGQVLLCLTLARKTCFLELLGWIFKLLLIHMLPELHLIGLVNRFVVAAALLFQACSAAPVVNAMVFRRLVAVRRHLHHRLRQLQDHSVFLQVPLQVTQHTLVLVVSLQHPQQLQWQVPLRRLHYLLVQRQL